MGNIIAIRKESTDFWPNLSTGDWETDCNIGRANAERMIAQVLAEPDDHLPVFVRSMRDMVTKGNFGGVETGFFTALMGRVTVASDATSPAHGSSQNYPPIDLHSHRQRGI